ncbi:hypothetical protein CERSUDRAFT_77634 [Gelatoporia subvermispora B]|uniref:F-box domain-containing protein n=1 Tax=Ceriporiopsis subvermispora (strain B) TaxID=914234 RepID=M2QZN4_CERS8|nr:hypothetical protein CERSUDRAFT_77634 [Gelatoporia subvermispora B]
MRMSSYELPDQELLSSAEDLLRNCEGLEQHLPLMSSEALKGHYLDVVLGYAQRLVGNTLRFYVRSSSNKLPVRASVLFIKTTRQLLQVDRSFTVLLLLVRPALNATLLICQLPPEILGSIFRYVPGELEDMEDTCWESSVLDCTDILPIAAVCRYWRTVAVNDGYLWANLGPRSPVELSLQRARNVPLRIHLPPGNDSRRDSLLSSGRSIEELHLACRGMDPKILETCSGARLRVLTLLGLPDLHNMCIFQDDTPRLQDLALICSTIPANSFANLSHCLRWGVDVGEYVGRNEGMEQMEMEATATVLSSISFNDSVIFDLTLDNFVLPTLHANTILKKLAFWQWEVSQEVRVVAVGPSSTILCQNDGRSSDISPVWFSEIAGKLLHRGIEELWIESCDDPTRAGIRTVLHSLSNLTTLVDWIAHTRCILDAFDDTDDGNLMCPKLTTLRLLKSKVSSNSLERVLKFLDTRTKLGHPVEHVIIESSCEVSGLESLRIGFSNVVFRTVDHPDELPNMELPEICVSPVHNHWVEWDYVYEDRGYKPLSD